ncbi:hypothetical protein [Paenibacillus favisporus]|uniref:hypothetical protein n=1 Tax=Paenibacillus favisporus TaxID=221028 RepID=UPI003D2ACC4D
MAAEAFPVIGYETYQNDELYRFLRAKGAPVTPIRNESIGRFFGFIDRYSVP